MSISIAEVEESVASALSAIAGAKDLAELKVVKSELKWHNTVTDSLC